MSLMIRSLLAATLLAGAAALAQTPATWTGPDSKRVPKKGDIEFALSEVCLPHLTGMQTIEQIAGRQRLKLNGGNSGGFIAINSGDIVVELRVGTDGNLRLCEVIQQSGDAATMLSAARDFLTRWPAQMKLARSNRIDTRFIAYEVHCGPAGGLQDVVEIVAGTGDGKAKQKRIRINAVRGAQERRAQCDSDIPFGPQAAP